jgi:hypothetical protein
MACRGVHFAITAEDVQKLCALSDEDDRVSFVLDDIEEKWEATWVFETDKAWDAIHRALGDGTLDLSQTQFPLGHAIFGGDIVVGREDYYVILKPPAQAIDIGIALRAITREELHKRYMTIPEAAYDMPLSAEDFEYTWNWFEGLGDFFVRAGEAGRSVIFTVDQ